MPPRIGSRIPYASISALCLGQFFAPRLKFGDHVAYITLEGTYSGLRQAHRRLVANPT
jgi:hypothetical protein